MLLRSKSLNDLMSASVSIPVTLSPLIVFSMSDGDTLPDFKAKTNNLCRSITIRKIN